MDHESGPMRGRYASVLKAAVLLLVTGIAGAVVLHQPPMAQDPAYHDFADKRTMLGIAHALNVLSNVFFLSAGYRGIYAWMLRRRSAEPMPAESQAWVLLFGGVFLTGLGSAWYHLAPSNQTLVLDRLPMSLGFSAFFAAVIGERISQRAYRLLVWPLVGAGVASVLFWHVTEAAGSGDLRFYILVQFFPLLTIPLIMLMYEPVYSHGRYVVFALLAYGIAKAAEHWDQEVYQLTAQLVSGHTLKHVIAAIGCWVLYRMYLLRERLADAAESE